jgi:hypothetical protein
MHRSGLDRSALQGARDSGRPLAAVGSLAQPERWDAVLALVVRDLARTWTTRRRMRGPTSRKMETVEPSQQQSARMAAAKTKAGRRGPRATD